MSKTISVRLDDDLVERIEKLASGREWTRSHWVASRLERAVELEESSNRLDDAAEAAELGMRAYTAPADPSVKVRLGQEVAGRLASDPKVPVEVAKEVLRHEESGAVARVESVGKVTRRSAKSVEPAAPAGWPEGKVWRDDFDPSAEEKVQGLMAELEEKAAAVRAAEGGAKTTYHLVIEANGPFFTGTLAETGKEFKGMSRNDVREKAKAYADELGGEYKLVVR